MATPKAPFKISAERVKELIAKPPKDRYRRNLPDRKVFLFEQYSSFIHSRAVFVVQVCSSRAADYAHFKRDLKAKGLDLIFVNNKAFNYVARKEKRNALQTAVAGPCAVVYSDHSDDTHPLLVREFMDLLKHHKRFLLMGGIFEGEMYSLDLLEHIKSLPSKKQSQMELLGCLESSQRRLVGVLGQKQMEMVLVLDQHQKNISE